MQSQRSKAYSSDLRWRMVYQKHILGHTFSKIAENLNVDVSTVRRILCLFEETGTVSSLQGYREVPLKKLNAQDKISLISTILENPTTYLHELKSILLQSSGIDISTSCICKFLHNSGFSHKKLTLRAQQRCMELRQKFTNDMTIYAPDMLVFVDETGTDKRSCLRKYGYSLVGKRAVSEKMLVRGKRFSAISAMSRDGILDVSITTQSIDGDAFCGFVERILLPNLLPFDGINGRSVVILDNATIHHVAEVEALIEETGAILIYLPPYSPDLNPIEECFSKVKGILRENDALIQIANDSEIQDIILGAFSSITVDDCQQWIEHCGYN